MERILRIAVAHASVGSGHRRAAEALAAELASLAPENTEVEVLDALDFSSRNLSGDSLAKTFTGPTARLYDRVWHARSTGAFLRNAGTPLFFWQYRALASHFLEQRYDAIVCTHALPAILAAHLADQGKIKSRVVVSTTDFGLHGMWPTRGVSLFCTANERAAEVLAREAIETLAAGIPVRRQFTRGYDVTATRSHFHLPEKNRVILAIAGSQMAGPYERFKEGLAVALPEIASLPGVTLAIVTGSDFAYEKRLAARVESFRLSSVRLLGNVEHMAPLMAASDVALAKPGGLVCAECLDSDLPLVLVGPAIGQERANADALVEAEAAVLCPDARSMARTVTAVMREAGRLDAMREAAAAVARPFAAHDIAERTLELLGIAATPE